jgi:hypothetical protein
MGDYFWFDSVFIKKLIKSKFSLKKLETDQFRFSFVGKNQFKPVWLGFFGLALFWLDFFQFESVFFRFQAYKIETELVGFLKFLIGFFHGSVFSVIFSGFLGLINFLIFVLTPNFNVIKENKSHLILHIKLWFCSWPL